MNLVCAILYGALECALGANPGLSTANGLLYRNGLEAARPTAAMTIYPTASAPYVRVPVLLFAGGFE